MRQEKPLFYCSRINISYCRVQGLNPDRNAMQLMLCCSWAVAARIKPPKKIYDHTKDTLGRTETKKRGRSKKGPDPPLRGPQCSYPTRSLGVSPQKEGEWSPLTPATDAYNPRAVNRHGTAKVTNIEGFPQGSIPCPAGIKYTKIGITEALFAFPGLIENNLFCYNL